MFQGYYNQQEQGFPWQESERHHGHHHGGHGHHGHRGQYGPQFEGPRGPWGRGFGGSRGFGGPRGQWGGPQFEGRGPWGRGFGGYGRGFGGYGRPELTPEQQVLRSTAGEVMRLFVIAARSSFGNTERQGQLRSFLERARTELLNIVGETKTDATAQQQGQQAEQSNVEQV